jgi:hypothetical protein
MEELAETAQMELFEKYNGFLKSISAIIPKAPVYLNSKLHDSWVEAIEYDENHFSMTLNDFSAHCFADAIVTKYNLKIAHKKLVLPVRILFENVASMILYKVNFGSKILPLEKKEKYIPFFTEFQYDEVASVSKGHIEIGLAFWSQKKGKVQDFFLDINCGHIHIEELQRQAFTELFGGNYIDLFETYWQERLKGNPLDYSDCCKLLGLPRSYYTLTDKNVV